MDRVPLGTRQGFDVAYDPYDNLFPMIETRSAEGTLDTSRIAIICIIKLFNYWDSLREEILENLIKNLSKSSSPDGLHDLQKATLLLRLPSVMN